MVPVWGWFNALAARAACSNLSTVDESRPLARRTTASATLRPNETWRASYTAAAAPEPVAVEPPRADQSRWVLEIEGRRIQVDLSVDGDTIKTEVLERYKDPGTASSAFDRLKEAMAAEGYRPG